MSDSGHRCVQSALREAGVTIYGTEATTVLLAAPEAPSLRHEYGTLEVTVDLVEDMQEAIDKIHQYGSGHTEVRVPWSYCAGCPSCGLQIRNCTVAAHLLLCRQEMAMWHCFVVGANVYDVAYA